MKRVKIVGAGGYGGAGLMELLCRHPEVEIACLVAKDDVNKPVTDVYPHLRGFVDSADRAAGRAGGAAGFRRGVFLHS